MSTLAEKGGGSFQGLKLLLCENPLPPLDEAIEAARMELARSNLYTEPYSAPLRQLIVQRAHVKGRSGCSGRRPRVRPRGGDE